MRTTDLPAARRVIENATHPENFAKLPADLLPLATIVNA
jgi:hypothetical protein